MHTIHVTARFTNVSDDNRAEFELAAAAALKISKREPGVLRYDWFFDETGSVCVVHEAYQDTDALLAHIVNVGDTFARLVDLGGGCELEVFGDMGVPIPEAGETVRRSIFRSRLQGK